MKMRLTLLTLATALLCGCGQEPEKPSSRSWTSNWSTEELGIDDTGEKPPSVAAADDQAADVQPPVPPKVAVNPAAGIFGGIPPAPEPLKVRNQPKPERRVVVRLPVMKKDIPKPIATPARKPVIPIVAAGPRTKEMYGIPWHTSVDDALASATKPGLEKPVMVFRVLGSLSGFM